MSTVFSATTPIQLNWIKSRIKGRYELIANGPILGSLQRVGFWKSITQAEFKGRAWSFQRCGNATTKIMEEPGARLVAQFKPNWLGGGWLSFNDGERFQLIAKGFWRPVWSWLNAHGQKLLEVAPNEKCVRLIGMTGPDDLNSSQNRLPVLDHVLLASDTANQRQCSRCCGYLRCGWIDAGHYLDGICFLAQRRIQNFEVIWLF